MISLAFGHWDDAWKLVRTSLTQDPLDPNTLELSTWIHMRRGQMAEAEAAMRRALDIRPTYSWGHYYLGFVLLERDEREGALAEMQLETDPAGKQQGLAMAYYALGRMAESGAALDRLVKQHADANAYGISEVYAFRGQLDEAMQWLDRAYAQRDSQLAYVKSDLPFKNLEADTRYKAFLRKMNLPE